MFASHAGGGGAAADRPVVTAPGKVTAITGNLMVQPLEMSLVRSINVKEGQLVHAGDVLAELDPTFAQADVGSLEAQVASLQAEVDRLTAETQNRPYVADGSPAGQLQAMMFGQRQAELNFKTGGLRAEDRGGAGEAGAGRSDVASLSERVKLASEVEGKRRRAGAAEGGQPAEPSAGDGHAVVDRRSSWRRQSRWCLGGAAGHGRADRPARRRRETIRRPTTAEQLTEQGRKLADAREQLNKAQLRRKLVQLRAERDAIVLRLAPVSVGTVMQSGAAVHQLVPLDAPLQIDAMRRRPRCRASCGSATR